tara:strand:- start:64 stop:498 length:435 start_codon:yes stop_codon:yes gene_type:complete
VIDYIILSEQRLIVERLRGHVSLTEVEEITERIWQDPAYDKSFSIIADIREADLGLDRQDIQALSDMILSSEDASQGTVAILSTKPVETAMSYLFSRRLATKNPVAVFSTWDAVGRFVSLSPSMLEFFADDQAYDALFETEQNL